jgi:hypothetical protein
MHFQMPFAIVSFPGMLVTSLSFGRKLAKKVLTVSPGRLLYTTPGRGRIIDVK